MRLRCKFPLLLIPSVGFSVWNPVTVLFNLLLSLTGKWHSAAETRLVASTLDYTILRPGGLSDAERGGGHDPNGAPVTLQLEVADEPPALGGRAAPMPPPGRLGRADLAALAVACVDEPRARNRILACRWVGAGGALGGGVAQGSAFDGSSNWAGEFAKLPPSPPPPPPAAAANAKSRPAQVRPYATAVAVVPPAALVMVCAAASLFKRTVAFVVATALR